MVVEPYILYFFFPQTTEQRHDTDGRESLMEQYIRRTVAVKKRRYIHDEDKEYVELVDHVRSR